MHVAELQKIPLSSQRSFRRRQRSMKRVANASANTTQTCPLLHRKVKHE